MNSETDNVNKDKFLSRFGRQQGRKRVVAQFRENVILKNTRNRKLTFMGGREFLIKNKKDIIKTRGL